MRRLLKLTFIMGVIFAYNIQAAGVDALMKHFDDNGAMVNYTEPAVINDQMGGYMTGGSLIVRGARPKVLQPLRVEMPNFKMDACTGSMDFTFGGLSFIRSEDFVSFFKKIPNAAAAYAMKMMLTTISPVIHNTISDLESIARDINGLTIDQCSTAQAIAGGVFNAMKNGKQQECMMKSSLARTDPDMHAVTQECKNNDNRNQNVGNNNEFKSLLGDEYNLVWKAISELPGGNEFKEFMMSISGSIIRSKKNVGDDRSTYYFTIKPSLVTNSKLLDSYVGMNGQRSEVMLYNCINNGDNRCLDMHARPQALGEADSFYGQIERILNTLIPKVQDGRTDLTTEERAVISMSSIPLINLIEMELAGKANPEHTLMRMHEFIEVICYDVITNFLEQVVRRAEDAVKELSYVQTSDMAPVKEFIGQVREVRQYLRDTRISAFKRLQVVTQMKERIEQQQKAFEAGFIKITRRYN